MRSAVLAHPTGNQKNAGKNCEPRILFGKPE